MSEATPSTQFADKRTEGAVRIQDVDKIYPVQNGAVTALKNVNVSVGGGEFVSILGPCGCGKSTLLRCVAGLDRPTSGSITLGGRPVDVPPIDLGFVFQRDVLVDLWRRIINVLLPRQIKKL